MPYATFLRFDVIDVAGLILPYCTVCNTNREIPDNSDGDDRQKQDNYLQKSKNTSNTNNNDKKQVDATTS